ncbi:GTPase/DUF3482 domain-containing protein [Pseudomonas sp. RIT-PI-S]|uniref:GTPase/DUF3482 domain-containing protein n=1 Tax=Pseudomonas sp. RIT-PI-S TaxID=3035295 RepID=UPI0021D82417|nr:GTPase/DUF3482 domain-containing protein [Pseudomonas sp. RIT-PI-S]
MPEALKLAVVGHTNVGKTSLLRTLTRDGTFGEVSHRPGTTRHVEGARLSVQGQALVELYDTPGLEDAVALLEYLERLGSGTQRLDGPGRIEAFLASSEARQRFEQEAKVVRQLGASDAGLYVIDAREPILAKYRDELQILASCGKPLLPVLNFVSAASARRDAWQAALARLGLHALVSFDTVAPPEDGERRLYESLALLIERARPALQRLIEDQQRQAEQRLAAGRALIAELLIDCAACRRAVAEDAEAAQIQALRETVRQREQACVSALLALFGFRPGDADAGTLPLLDGRWNDDLFNPETLRQLGVKVGGGMAAGAAAGAGVDLMAGGLTLGLATLAGALAGGAVQTARGYGGRLLGKWRGEHLLSVDDAVLRLLALRQQALLQALARRGHAAQESLLLPAQDPQQWRQGRLPAAVKRARAHPEWSALNPGFRPGRADREQALIALASEL